MPPANSPDPEQPMSFISALRELESPVDADVLNLASTLGTRTQEQDRRRERLQHHMRRDRQRGGGNNDDDPDDNHRLRRVMSRLSRLDDSSAAYGDRVPSANNLYDWSPATEADDEELDSILDELRREQPNTHPEILRVLGRSQLDSQRNRMRSLSTRLSSDRPPGAGSGGDSLRSTAILQSVRRHPRFSARMSQRHSTDSRPMSESARQLAQRAPTSESRHSLDRERRDMLSRADSYRRNFLDHRTSTSTSTPTVSPLLEQTVKYLSRIRHAETIDDSLNHALDAGFLSKDYFCMQYTDFLTDTTAIPPPAETSWLAPGAVLSGCQHATSVAAAVTAAYDSSVGGLPMLAPPSRPWLANSYSTPRSRTAQLAPEVAPPPNPQQDRWPVKVTIHEVDWESMTLSATMEAYNVPSHPHSLLNSQSDPTAQQYTRTSSITTYLEGEILDFSNHTLLTESFKSNAANDATYWRKLPPFASMTDDDMIKALISKRWYTEVLHKEYILMRWKERCFVKSLNRSTVPMHSVHSHLQSDTPYRLVRNPNTNELQVEISHLDAEHATFDDSGCGLTISGFYYVCLSRRDGRVQGLYFDPQSSPYQCLELGSVRGGAVGAWSFR